MIVTFALIDSFDPCIYALFISLLASVISNIKYAFKIGISFLIAVYTGYYILGLFIRYITIRLHVSILAGLLLIYATFMFILIIIEKNGRTNELVCREDKIECKIINVLQLNKLLGRGVLFTILLGFIASFTLLPCTAGLYIVYNIVIREHGFATWAALTALYVFLFISPLILIFLMIIGAARTMILQRFIVGKESIFKLAGAVVMIITAIYLVLLSH
ncbi:hypothetical protein [Pseudothermotoga thermarum]|uniref:Cytochrome c biogenesis protein transmembrane region n=1 Tax=Pseudothermotoga thermarum DSM 5069 TaxID=688269 RepID=F7YTU4_9THEM|nr:hypothetical protein [Pseudothermotoga thermarum]AEH51389.1 cytochrome c biogenesis protein transmembrane region [Pseudothermotoga thermarum DSM 5069]